MKGNNTINSETVLAWVKRVEVQRVQAAVMSSITETKEFDRIKVSKRYHKDAPKKTTQARVPMRQPCGYHGSRHPQDNGHHIGKRAGCHKTGHFKAVCKSRKAREGNEI